MTPMKQIGTYSDALTALWPDLHNHLELGSEEQQTSGIVARLLETYGCTVYRGVSGIGVGGWIQTAQSGPSAWPAPS